MFYRNFKVECTCPVCGVLDFYALTIESANKAHVVEPIAWGSHKLTMITFACDLCRFYIVPHCSSDKLERVYDHFEPEVVWEDELGTMGHDAFRPTLLRNGQYGKNIELGTGITANNARLLVATGFDTMPESFVLRKNLLDFRAEYQRFLRNGWVATRNMIRQIGATDVLLQTHGDSSVSCLS